MAFLLALTAASASAETLLMPNRDMLMSASEVVWGVTTLDNHNTGGIPTTYEFDFENDGTFDVSGNVTDRSFIAVNRTFLAGTHTIRLRVTRGAVVEDATTVVQVYDGSGLNAADLRNLNINRAIQNGLRHLWTIQTNRAGNFPAGTTTSWAAQGFPGAYTALVTLAFENHGYQVPNNGDMPTGLYQKYIVRRGLNFVLNTLSQVPGNLTVQTAGNPCVGAVEAAPCVGLRLEESGHSVYETGLAVLPLAASGAMDRTVGEIAGTNSGGYVVGKTYREVLQRLVNAIAWGQGDTVNNGLGGWHYALNNQASGDGSSEGWIMLALLDAEASGATIPAFVRTQWSQAGGALARGLNNDGSFDYQADNSRANNNAVNVAKTGVGLQGMYFAGRPLADPDVQNALTWISDRWAGASVGAGQGFFCGGGQNKSCGYGMFNAFKGLKLYGVNTLPGVNRTGTFVGDVDDWHADYQDWLVANQTSPLVTTGGNWATLQFSSQVGNNTAGGSAEALLILAPTALVLPDPTTFSTVGLKHGNPLDITPQTNPVGTSHTVTAIATAANGNPVATATINFLVISGPNQGKSGQAVTNGQGQATFTYTDTAGPGTDEIRASIGALQSNVVVKHWVVANLRCDADADGDVDNTDLGIIRAAMRQNASGPADPRDGNGDGVINIADVRYCQPRLTPVP